MITTKKTQNFNYAVNKSLKIMATQANSCIFSIFVLLLKCALLFSHQLISMRPYFSI